MNEMGLKSDKNPAKLGRYILEKRVGMGGMGVVYRARLEGLAGFEKTVALKCILPHLVRHSPQFVKDLISEAKISVLMNHPNIIQVYDLGQVGEEVYLSMEFVEGISLLSVILKHVERSDFLPVEAVVNVLVQAANGLEYAHNLKNAQGTPLDIIHRDVSPQNLLLSYGGIVKIIDFGIAKAATNLELTDPGIIKGKVSYMAPEQLAGHAIDHRADVFSAGVVLFEALTNRRLFGHGSGANAVGDLFTTRVPSMRDFRYEISDELDDIVHKALARKPEERFQSAAELSKALRGAVPLLDPADLAELLDLAPVEGGEDDRLQEEVDAAIVAAAAANPGGMSLIGTSEEHLAAAVKTSAPSREADVRAGESRAKRSRSEADKRGSATARVRRGDGGSFLFATILAFIIAGTVLGASYLWRFKTQQASDIPERPTAQQQATAKPDDAADTKAGPVDGADATTQDKKETPDASGKNSADKGDEKKATKDAAAKTKKTKRSDRKRTGRTKPRRDKIKPPPKTANDGPPTKLEMADINKAVGKYNGRFISCIEKNIDPEKHAAGTVFVTLKFQRDGAIREAQVSPEAYAKTKLGQCLIGVAKLVKVRPHSEDLVEVRYPFEVSLQ